MTPVPVKARAIGSTPVRFKRIHLNALEEAKGAQGRTGWKDGVVRAGKTGLPVRFKRIHPVNLSSTRCRLTQLHLWTQDARFRPGGFRYECPSMTTTSE